MMNGLELKYTYCLYLLIRECSEECVHSHRLGFVGGSLHWKMPFVPCDSEYGGTSVQKAIQS